MFFHPTPMQCSLCQFCPVPVLTLWTSLLTYQFSRGKIIQNVFSLYGVLNKVVSDCGLRQDSGIITCMALDIDVSLSSASYPQWNGETEHKPNFGAVSHTINFRMPPLNKHFSQIWVTIHTFLIFQDKLLSLPSLTKYSHFNRIWRC